MSGYVGVYLGRCGCAGRYMGVGILLLTDWCEGCKTGHVVMAYVGVYVCVFECVGL